MVKAGGSENTSIIRKTMGKRWVGAKMKAQSCFATFE